MALDAYTQLRQMGYSGTLGEMQSKYIQDITGLDTIGEQLLKALDAAMARQVLEITAVGSGLVDVPGDLNTTGIPDGTKALFGDGTWKVPAGGGGGGGGTDPNAAHPANSENITGIWNYTTQPTGIVKASVGLANVDNTTDANKPISTAQAAVNTAVSTGKANTAHNHAWTDIVSGVPNFIVADGSGHLTPANAPAATVFRVLVGPGQTFTTQPLRNVVTSRTDIFIQWVMGTLPLSTTGYAITGDSWKRR